MNFHKAGERERKGDKKQNYERKKAAATEQQSDGAGDDSDADDWYESDESVEINIVLINIIGLRNGFTQIIPRFIYY